MPHDMSFTTQSLALLHKTSTMRWPLSSEVNTSLCEWLFNEDETSSMHITFDTAITPISSSFSASLSLLHRAWSATVSSRLSKTAISFRDLSFVCKVDILFNATCNISSIAQSRAFEYKSDTPTSSSSTDSLNSSECRPNLSCAQSTSLPSSSSYTLDSDIPSSSLSTAVN